MSASPTLVEGDPEMQRGSLNEVDLGLHMQLDEKDENFNTLKIPLVLPGLSLNPIPNESRYLLLAFSADPLHPADPLTWSISFRYWLTILAATLVMSTALASSAPSGGGPFIQAQLGGQSDLLITFYLLGYAIGPFATAPLSEAFGRRKVSIYGTFIYTAFSGACIAAPSFKVLLILRFFAGCTGATPTTNSGAICGDIWNARDRGFALSYYSVASFAGPALGPVFASFISKSAGWRYIFVILTAFSAVLCVLVIFACPETYPPLLVTHLAKELRKTTGDERIVSRLEYAEIVSRGTPPWTRFKSEATRILATPIVMFFNEWMLVLITAFMCQVYGLIYIVFEIFPYVFGEIHGFSPGYSSLPFLGTLVGAVISVPLSIWFQKKYLADVESAGGHSEPEMRLPMATAGGLLTVIAFIWLAWTGYKESIPWILPSLTGIPQGIGSILVFRSTQTYLIDTYERNAASAMAVTVIARAAAGATYPLFAHGMVVKLGVNWACTLLAGIMFLLCPVPIMFQRYGRRIRKTSKFAGGR